MSETLTLTTCRDVRQARRIARALVGEGLAACVNVVPGLASVYRWKGRVEEAREALLLVKSTSARGKRLEARIRELHTYESPEVVTLKIDGGSAPYLRWIRESVR
jgi:periplasmic divalent cation tolerance protein